MLRALISGLTLLTVVSCTSNAGLASAGGARQARVWVAQTTAMVQSGSTPDGYGDATALRNGPPSLYDTAWWSCVAREAEGGADTDWRRATIKGLDGLLSGDGAVGVPDSSESDLPAVYRLELVTMSLGCLRGRSRGPG